MTHSSSYQTAFETALLKPFFNDAEIFWWWRMWFPQGVGCTCCCYGCLPLCWIAALLRRQFSCFAGGWTIFKYFLLNQRQSDCQIGSAFLFFFLPVLSREVWYHSHLYCKIWRKRKGAVSLERYHAKLWLVSLGGLWQKWCPCRLRGMLQDIPHFASALLCSCSVVFENTSYRMFPLLGSSSLCRNASSLPEQRNCL